MIAASNISVQIDINSVPRPSSAAPQEEESFARSLDDAERSYRDEAASRQPERVDSRNPQVPTQASPQGEDGAEPGGGSEARAEAERSPARAPATAQAEVTGEVGAPLQGTIQGGGPGRRIMPGKGPGSPSTILKPGAGAGAENPGPVAPSGAALAPNTIGAAGALAGAAAGTAAGTAANAGSATGSAPLGGRLGVDAADAGRGTARATKGPGPSFRTYDAQARELQAQTRDSMFKQIAFKLLPSGGEMRMRLDPPHLGNLDVNLVVEHGVVLQLGLGAERADVAQMLERSLPELKQFLASQGLALDDSAVFTFEFAEQPQTHGQEGGAGTEGHAAGHAEAEEPAAPRHQGWITADGLDFWV